MTAKISIPDKDIRAFCQRWKIVEMSLFGSVLRSDFRADSDIDVLVKFSQDESWNLLNVVSMKEELSEILGRKIDFVEEKCLKNPFRKQEIMRTRDLIYAA